MNIIYGFLMILQFLTGIGLIVVVMSQSGKDQGMGSMGGGGQADGGSRFKSSYEERLDNLAKNLAFAFLGISFVVAIMTRVS